METLIPIPSRPGVHVCDKCGGLFADIATSNRIVETLDRQILELGFRTSLGKQKPKDDGRALTCPECQIAMAKNRIESAACDVDACPIHGTWFDTNELVDVMRALDRARKHGIVMTRDRPSMPVNLATTAEPARSLAELLTDWLGVS